MPASEFRAALAAVSFLTRVPVPGEIDGEDVRRAAAYFPLVGAAVGAAGVIVARRWGGPAGVVAETVLTGALHLDALADSADALGTRERERALEIMRDSRIGSFGTAAMCLDLLVKARALERCSWPTAVGAGALSRAVPVVLSAALPYARPSGTGQAMGAGSGGRAILAVAGALALSRDRRAALIAALVTTASGAFWSQRIAGVTGDTLGASIELTQTLILAGSVR